MLERFCALLRRIYPAEFRRAYGPEAEQRIRDRARDERGIFRYLRLLMDLAIDLVATLLHGWQPGAPSPERTDAAPCFDIIAVHGPRNDTWTALPVETIETLPSNVGHVKLNGFAEATICQETTARAMASLNEADALVIDLRDNGGGFGETALQNRRLLLWHGHSGSRAA